MLLVTGALGTSLMRMSILIISLLLDNLFKILRNVLLTKPLARYR
jgi:hypothetical protein